MAKRPKVENWFRTLDDGRMEVFLSVADMSGVEDIKIRASGREDTMYELVNFFEGTTGLNVDGNWRRPARQALPGQTQLVIGELSSQDATVDDHG